MTALSTSLLDNHIRILVQIEKINAHYENSAPDFLKIENDTVSMEVLIRDRFGKIIYKLGQTFRLKIEKVIAEEESIIFSIEEDIYVDEVMDVVKDLWIGIIEFKLISASPRYVQYIPTKANHTLVWQQKNSETKEIVSLSVSSRSYTPPTFSGTEKFATSDILKCTDMICRAMQKIDVRTGNALVIFNTDKGKLEALLREMALRLGFEITPLQNEEQVSLRAKKIDATHIFSLRR